MSIALLILSFLLITFSCYAQKPLEKFDSLVNAGQFDFLLKNKEEFLQSIDDNDHVSRLFLLGKSFFNSFLYDSAESYLLKSIELNDGKSKKLEANCLLFLSLSACELRKFTDSKESLRRSNYLIEKYELGELLPILNYATGIYKSYSQQDDASFYLKQSLYKVKDNDPLIVDIYIALIDLYVEELNFSEASYYINEIKVIIADKFSENHYKASSFNLIYSYYLAKSGDLKEALHLLDVTHKMVSDQGESWKKFILAEQYRYSTWPLRDLGFYYEAIEACHNYLNLIKELLPTTHSRYGETYRMLSAIYWNLRNYELAEKYAYLALGVFSNSTTNASLLNKYFIKCRFAFQSLKYKEAISYSDSILNMPFQSKIQKLYSNYVSYYRAVIYYRKGDYSSSVRELNNYIPFREKSIVDLKEMSDAYSMKIFGLMKSGLVEEGRKFAKTAIKKIENSGNLTENKVIDFYNNLSDLLISEVEFDSVNIFLSKVIKANDLEIRLKERNYLLQSRLSKTYY